MTELKTFSTRVSLLPAIREKMIPLLNQHLADLLDLATQVKQAHWNVKGHHFYSLHLLFDSLAAELYESVDTVAERATALGGSASGTARMAAKASRLPEYPTDAVDGMAHVTALCDRYAAVGGTVRTAIKTASEAGDDDTADLFTGLSRDLDKNLWFLEAHLQGK